MRFIDAYFTNNEKTVVTTLWENDNKEVIEETVLAEANEPAWENLLNQPNVTLDNIHERTFNRNKEQRELFEQSIIDIAKRDGLWEDIHEHTWTHDHVLLKVANMILLDEEDIKGEALFKFKLKLFENKLVEESTNREAKSELRKSKNYYDALVAYRKFKK